MFTIEQIQRAHAKVQSGADFPAYIQARKNLGVTSYETFVIDGQTHYAGRDGHEAKSPAKYASIAVAEKPNKPEFEKDLKAHQQRKSDYPTFVSQAAASGIWKWSVDLEKMTCTYFDKSGKELLAEQIPR